MGRAGQLHKPQIGGAHGELKAALHRLHLHAGRPSLADIARQLSGAGISRSTVHDAFSSPRLPKWRVIDALVEILSAQTPGGRPEEDQAVLHEVWLRAAQESDEQHAAPIRRASDETEALAHTMQRLLLPDRLPKIAGVELASRYLPRTELGGGGDWFDAIPLPEGQVALVVGDVMGYSVLSVALMAQIRSAMRVLVELGLQPHEVLNRLDAQAQRLSDYQMATCLCAVYDPDARRLDISSAGHLPPLWFSDGEAMLLEVPTGMPIGVGTGNDCETASYSVPPETTLLLFTDGLVESRRQGVDDGLGRLRMRLGTAIAESAEGQVFDLEPWCDLALQNMANETREDDVALLAARLS
ncbi:PP2C family protein-serine/threonine phosphatase [Streptomyces sp. PA03-5A]|nr:PP2C family protein-serine/threonine phosphatase [Streptomyces sp. PA03-5A]